jgi:predicted permease
VLFSEIVWVDSPLDGRILLYTLLAALATGVLTGLLPALQSSRPELAGMLKEGVREGRAHRSGTRLALLLVQAALTVVLLVGTGLFVRSLRRVESIPLGMEPDHVLVAQLQTTGRSYTSREMALLYDRFLEVARATPGVERATLAVAIPFWSSWAERVSLPGRDSVPLTRDGGPYFNAVGPDFFQTLGTRILRGRGFTISDQAKSQRVAVVNETLARLWWPGEDALGKCMKVGGDTMPCSEVVGIVANARRQSMVEDESVQYYLPLDQAPRYADSRVLFVRPAGEARLAVEVLRRRLQAASPDLPYVRVRPLSNLVSPQMRSWRLGATMFGAFGLLALVLASVGLYGMLAYDVTQRTRELGVRMALGAQRAQLARMIVGEGMRTAALGGVIGVTIALASAALVKPLLYETSPRDPAVYVVVLLVLGVVALVATLLPARRAVHVDPIVAMRTE